MKTKTNTTLLIHFLCALAALSFGQNTATAPGDLFNEIMQSLSIDNKAIVDSASGFISPNENKGSSKTTTVTDAVIKTNSNDAILGKLSEEERIRVEKASQDVEKEKRDRKIQMMEIDKRK